MSVNKVILLGYVGKDPEMKEFESGKVAKMTIATTEKGYKLKDRLLRPSMVSIAN